NRKRSCPKEGGGRSNREGPRGPSRGRSSADRRGIAGDGIGVARAPRGLGKSHWPPGPNGQGGSHPAGLGGDEAEEALHAGDSRRLMFSRRLSRRSEEHTSELQSPDHLVC